MSTSPRDGIVWDDLGWALEPKWASEPSIEAIQATCRRVLQLDASDDCSVSFMAEGAFNKVYLVEDNCERRWAFRVSLPVDPHLKVAGEAATLCWLERHSDIPAPKVIDFDASRDNEIGYEWILMDLMPGTSAYRRWRKMTMEAKKTLVEKIAEYQAQLFNSEFRTIGTLKDESLDADSKPDPGKLVNLMFFMGKRYDLDVPRGPYRSSHDWLKSFISVINEDQKRVINELSNSDPGPNSPPDNSPPPDDSSDSDIFLYSLLDDSSPSDDSSSSDDSLDLDLPSESSSDQSSDSDSDSDSDSSSDSLDSSDSDSDSDSKEKAVAEYTIEVAELLADLLPDIFPKVLNPPERTVLVHDDLSLDNILVDDDGAITAIIDWECVSAVPLWFATRMPKFLLGPDREESPDRDGYMDDDEEMEAAKRLREGNDYLDSEGKNPLYWYHLMEYERTELRKLYTDRLSELCPAWGREFADSGLKRDFYEAIFRCADRWRLIRIDDWVGEIWEGEFPTMAEMMKTGRT